MVKRLFYCLSLAVLVSLVCPDALAQGLGFYGMSNKIDERTSYTVFGNKTICFKDSFQMEFEGKGCRRVPQDMEPILRQ